MLSRRVTGGFSLIELMIGLVLVALLLSFGMPSFSVWLQNTRIRGAAESLQAGLQMARAEAVRRNTSVIVSLTDTVPISANASTVSASSTGSNWMLRIFQSSGTYGEADFIEGGALAQGGASVALERASGDGFEEIDSLIFNGLGQVSALRSGTTVITDHGEVRAELSSSLGGVCQHEASTGEMRCLRLVISRGGQIRMCDPKVTDVSDPRGC